MGTVYLTDFGLAKATATGSKYTRAGQALGTPAFMSPEQARGEADLTPATDVWSLGCVLYLLLAGRPPFEGTSAEEVVGHVLLREPTRIRQLRPDTPPALDTLVHACVSKPAAGRPGSAGALRDDLARLLRGERPAAGSPRRRRAAVLAAGVVAVVAGALALRLATRGGGPARPPPPPPSVAEALAARSAAVRHTDPREAERLLGEALAAEPARPTWRLQRGLLRWAVGDSAGAREEWDRVPGGATEGPRARLYRGLASLFGRGALTPEGRRDAVADFQAAVREGGDVGTLASAVLSAEQEDWAAARAALRGLPDWEAALLRAYVEGTDPAGDRTAAAREYSQALLDGIPFAWAYADRGLARHELGDLAGALADFEVALGLSPDLTEALVGRAIVRRGQGDLQRAIADCDAALRRRTDSADAHAVRGEVRHALGDLAGALADYDAALRLRPDVPEVLERRAVARAAGGDTEGALQDFDVLVRLQPDSADARLNRGSARADQGDLAGAAEDYDAALRLRPDDLDALTNRGFVRLARGDPTGAIPDLEAVLRVHPGHPEARANLGWAQRALGQWEAAASAFREVLRTTPAHPRTAEFRQILAECEARAQAAAGGGG